MSDAEIAAGLRASPEMGRVALFAVETKNPK